MKAPPKPSFPVAREGTGFVGSSGSKLGSFLIAILGALISPATTHAAPGDLDTSFGTGGKVVTAVGAGEDRGHAVALQGDGKVVVAGYSHNGTNKDFCVVRYLADGTLDGDFGGGDGIVTTDFGGTNDIANGIAIQPDGKLVVVGGALNGSSVQIFALARYQTDGSLDTTFGMAGTGKFTTAIGAANSQTQANAVKVQMDGKIVVAGTAVGGNSHDFAIVRYNADGTMDDGEQDDSTPSDSFGTGGAVVTNHFNGDYATDLALQPDGKIVVCGQNSHGSMLVSRYNSDGSLDSGFSYVGQSFYSLSLALQGDGQILLAGATVGGGQDFRLTRLTATGALDTGFGINGVVTTGIGTAQDWSYDVALQPDGRIVVAGYSYYADTGFNDFAVVRYQTNGGLDTSFKTTGKVLGGFTGGNAEGRGMAIAPDGRILVAGYAHNGTNDDFALIRLFGSGSLATTAPAHGSHTARPVANIFCRNCEKFTCTDKYSDNGGKSPVRTNSPILKTARWKSWSWLWTAVPTTRATGGSTPCTCC